MGEENTGLSHRTLLSVSRVKLDVSVVSYIYEHSTTITTCLLLQP